MSALGIFTDSFPLSVGSELDFPILSKAPPSPPRALRHQAKTEWAIDWLTTQFNSGQSLILLLIILTVGLIITLIISQNGLVDGYCLYRMRDDNDMWQSYVDYWRGEDYFVAVNAQDPELRERQKTMARSCALTVWATLHMTLFAIIGFVVPHWFWLAFAVGILFEFMESRINCHCALDILWNLMGLTLGYSLRLLLLPAPGM